MSAAARLATGVVPFAIILLFSPIDEASAQTSPSGSEAPSFGGDLWNRSKLTGNWNGVRDDWAAHGFTIDMGTTYTLQGVASGGLPNTSTSLGNTLSTDVLFSLDTTKARLWPGGSFKLRLQDRTGVSALSRAGTVSPANASAVFPSAPGNTDENVFGLTELTYTQFLSHHFGVFGGLLNTLDADNNAIAGNMRSTQSFLNVAFLASPVEATAAPNVTLGGGAVIIPTPNIIGTVSIFNSEESATLDPFEHSTGTTFATEWTFKHHLFGRPGGQVAGFLYGIGKSRTDIARDPRVSILDLLVFNTIPTTNKNTWAAYYNAYQYIVGDEKHGWGPFLRFGVSDGDPNPIKYDIAAGLGGRGMLPGRPNDRWGAGYYHLDLSDKGLLQALKVGSENGGELFYNIAVTPAVHLTLDGQVGSSARPRQDTAVLLAARIGVEF